MNYYIELQESGGAKVYNHVTKKDGVKYYEKLGASPSEAVKRLMQEDFHKNVVIRSVDNEGRFGTWFVDFSVK